MSLQKKVSYVILLIVGLAGAVGEYLDRQYVGGLAQDNFQAEMAAVVRQAGAHITTLAEFRNRLAREVDLYKLMANRPDLVEISIYSLPSQKGAAPTLLVNAGNTVLSGFEPAIPPLVRRAIESERDVSDLTEWDLKHRLKLAAPISVVGRLVGATYAEFTTAQFDELLEYQRRLSLWRRLVTGLLIFMAINLFLYFKVHRPVGALLSGVDAVAQGDMGTTVSVGGQDEIGKLGKQFNAMVERIRAATEENRRLYEELQHAHDDLQVKVDEATARLSIAQREAARAQRLSAIGQLAATVAHKIGTPLTALSGHIQLLAEDPHMSSEARRRLQTVELQIDRTSKIIQDLLVYARKPEPVVAPLDINACVEECMALLRLEIERRNVVLDASLSPTLDKVQGDHQQLQEVFCNLIENALDAMPGGGVLRVRTHRPEGPQGEARYRVAVEIADTGHGIAPEHIEQVFQPFFTTKKARQGTGLGLAIALEVVRAHAGYITVESEVGKGARFAVLLPAAGRSA